MRHKAEWMGHPMRLELTFAGLLVKLANHYTIRGAPAATFNGNPKATIISCYSPTNVSEENELITFYEELSSRVRSIPKHNLLVIGGDMNAQIGKSRNNKYSLHNTSNRNGQHLIDFMIENRLTCFNTNFKKREGKLWT